MKSVKLLSIISLLAVTLLSSCGDTTSASPFKFQPVRGENPGEIIVYVTNEGSGSTLTNCRMSLTSDDSNGMVFATKMEPGQTALTGGTFNPGDKVFYWSEGSQPTSYTIPAIIPETIDDSQFDWAELPTLN